ncbi:MULTISPECIES: hypothetical protein [unclassified Leptolyngbya]|uniref:hypothetical protein n=1 Tax=unclassified Leptolyngbya TaxID=2650499 RepID=UPI001685739A|nr:MULTISPECIES: hypothetical protein [unclassified Leptolyngbya]MBD1913317.1 hypothetical protein [Leptolyngbya sp. FACHB-8]MBD2155336.1 hypothetical protein [Leptolyngbya sp. FACHB-16]
MSQLKAPSPSYILLDRQQYRTCHVKVPDLEQRLSAIQLGDQFYSFFQVAPEARKAIALLTKLVYRNESTVLTKMPRGYGVWVEEPDAMRVGTPSSTVVRKPASCLVLVNQYPHRRCRIQVPDLPQSVDAIAVDQNFYSIFKAELPAEQALEIIAKLLQRGDKALLLGDRNGYVIGIHEPEATLER